MTNKEKLKKVIEQDIGPNIYHNEIIKKIEKGDIMKKKNNIWKLSLMPICLVLVISVLLLNNSSLSKIKSNTEQKNIIYLKINNIDQILGTEDIAGSAIDLTIEELIKEEKFIENIKILTSFDSYRLMKRYNPNNEFIGYNLIYRNTDDNKQIDMFFSKTRKNKPRCVGTINLDELQNSKINDTNIKIFGVDSRYYYALFSYDNYNFDIETNNISEEELLSLLLDIIK